MDAVEFIKTCAKICREYGDCRVCILSDCCDHSCYKYDNYQFAEQAVANVLEWSKEHPVKTRQSEFLKMWSNAELDCEDVIAIDPCEIDKTMYGKYKGCSKGDCGDCRRDFWLKEINENEED